eukprot:475305-Rhodomonas_salina.1
MLSRKHKATTLHFVRVGLVVKFKIGCWFRRGTPGFARIVSPDSETRFRRTHLYPGTRGRAISQRPGSRYSVKVSQSEAAKQ